MALTKKTARASKRAPKKPTVADLLRARIERERRLSAKAPTAVLNEQLTHIIPAAQRLGISVWTLRHHACAGRLNYRRIGGRLYLTETEIARLAGSEVRAVNAA